MSVDQWRLPQFTGLPQTEEMKYSYTWTIGNFFHCVSKYGDFKESPCFRTNDDSKWSLRVYPKGRFGSSSVYIYLKLVSSNKTEIIARHAFSLLDREGKQTHKQLIQQIRYKQADEFRPILFERGQIANLLTGGKLTICCEDSVDEDTVNISGEGDLAQVKFPRACLSDSFGKLFEEMKLSDVTLVAGDGRENRAHKVILAARSEVFAAMFEHDMQERKLSRVDITDIDHEVLTEMLRFMYTDRTSCLDKMAADLLVAADKYVLDNLKLLCEEALCRNLSVETAADTLVLAHLHSVEGLKKQAIAFISSRHLRMVMVTEGWKKMASTYPHLVAELLSDIAVRVEQHLPIYK